MPSSAKKRTAAKKPQELAPTPASPAPASSPSSHKPITDAVSIERLVGLAKDSPSDSPLGIVWRCAFEEGKKLGYSEGAKLFEGVDISEGMRTAAERGYERGIEAGRNLEKRAWGAAGHSTKCITVARPPRGIAVQTENVPLYPVTTAAVQVDTPKSPPPCSVTMVAIQVDIPNPLPPTSHITSLPSTSLNWADDAMLHPISSPPISMLPISSPPILSNHLAPRDLSVLRSSSPKPFSSLQHRNRRSRAQFSQPLHDQQPFVMPHQNFSRRRFLPSRFSSTQFRSAPVYPHRTPHFSSPSALDWDQDPRLLNLSHALKALGWIRP